MIGLALQLPGERGGLRAAPLHCALVAVALRAELPPPAFSRPEYWHIALVHADRAAIVRLDVFDLAELDPPERANLMKATPRSRSTTASASTVVARHRSSCTLIAGQPGSARGCRFLGTSPGANTGNSPLHPERHRRQACLSPPFAVPDLGRPQRNVRPSSGRSGVRPAIRSAVILAVPHAMVQPMWPWPVL
jgi:hypothetical protein